MLAKIGSGATVGLTASYVEVEVDVADRGLPSFTIVGLPDKAVEESRERVRAALKNSGAEFPTTRITVNLAPADLPKAGPAYDLPIALGILIASGQTVPVSPKALFFGELSLDGSLRHTNGILPLAHLAKELGVPQIFIPKVNESEAAFVSDVDVIAPTTLLSLVRHLNKLTEIPVSEKTDVKSFLKNSTGEFDFSEIVGQESAKRAMEIAAAGGHNIFMKGTPGGGKTMLARAIPGILPTLTEYEALEVTKIYSITGNLSAGKSLITTRPFRSPHHTTSRIGLVGGGTNITPGEVSLAHRGVLFLDEFPEFPRNVMESLRQPMEDGIVTISRARGSVTYPANFMLVAAANPCPCGYYGDPKKACVCMPGQISRYEKRVSGPILDRIDIHINVPSVDTQKLLEKPKENIESSQSIQRRVQKARDIQSNRFAETTIRNNAEMATKDVKKYCTLSPECLAMLRGAIANMNLSARSYFKVIRVARTIADLEDKESISTLHLAEALQYRSQTNE